MQQDLGPCASPFEASNQLYTDSCNFYGFMNGVMLGPHDASASFFLFFRSALAEQRLCVVCVRAARNLVNTSKLSYGLCPGCCGEIYMPEPQLLRWMFDTFALSGVSASPMGRCPPCPHRLADVALQVNRLALWNLGDNLGGKAGWPPQLMAELAAFVRGGR